MLAICLYSPISFGQTKQNVKNQVATSNKLSLNDAIRTALDKHETIKMAQQNIKIAELDKHKGNAGYLPNISLQLQQNNQYSNPNMQTYFVNNTYFQNYIAPTVQAQWTAFNGFQQKITWQQLNTQVEIAKNDLKIIEQNKISQITQLYYTALAEQEKLAILKQIHAISSDQYALFKQQEQGGQASRYELLMTEQHTVTDEIALQLQRITYEKTLANLLMNMGSIAQNYYLSEPFENQHKYYSLEQLKNQSKQGSIAKKWELNSKIQQQNTELAKAKKYPTVTLNSATNWLYNHTRFPETTTVKGSNFDLYLGANVAMTLYNGGQIKRNIQKAILQTDIANWQQQTIERETNSQLSSKIDEYNNLQTLIQLNNQNISLIQETLALAEQRLEAGISNLNEFRTAQLNYLQAKYNYINIVLQCKLAENDIKLMTGAYQ